ncbi:MAG TPA: Gfo/Idh/MocA family oxidoreductase [Acidobacteriota bacterium]|nr:Gfo/Idh/MocA family oxidoreductase [Acidobacteriota bacterium]
MINIGIVGYGYWGPNVARNFHASGGAKLTAVSDLSDKRLGMAQNHYPFIRVSKNALDVIRAKDVDVVAVATPVYSHFELAKEALLAGKHIFVEKPFTSNSAQGRELVDLAAKKGLKIMVDHTVLFTGAVKKIKQVFGSGELGRLLFYDSVRVNLGLFQHDVNVIWDLAPHDLSVMDFLIDKKPAAITVHGSVHFEGGFEDIAYISIDFEDDGFIAHFHVNWLSPVKIRRTLISGDKKMLVYDDLSADEKVKIYDRGVDVKSGGPEKNGIHELLVSYRSGDASIPKLDVAEALLAEAQYFVQCLEKNEEPFNDGQAGLKIVQLLEAADESLKQGGRKVEL